jgi:hypothetical protein
MSKCLAIVPCLILLSGCSKVPVPVSMPPLPANLAMPCKPIDPLPVPFIDPDRLAFEANLIAAYGECAAKHAAAVKAVQKP